MSSLLGEARVRLRPDLSGFESAASSGIGSAMKKAAGVAAAAFAAAGVATFAKDIVNLSSAAEQSVGGVEAVFKNYAKTVQQSARDADTALGLSANSYRELATVIGSQLKNAGVPMEDLGASTDKLISQGADLAAMFGGTTQDAVNALSSALKGEMDPIERYGISLNDAALKAEALSLGLYDGTGTLDANAKAMAVMSLITKQGADAMGAFGRESDTAAGRQQRATAQWENFKTVLGDQLLPVFSTVMGFISSTAIPALENFSGVIADRIVPGLQGVYDLVVNGDFTGQLAAAFNISEDNPVVGYVLDAREAVLHAWDGLTGFWDGLDLSGLGDRVRDAVLDAGGEVVTGFTTGIQTGNWAPLGESIVGIVGEALSQLGSLAGQVFSTLSDLIGRVDWAGLALELGKQVPTLLLGLLVGIANFDFDSVFSFIGDHLFETIIALLTVIFAPAKMFQAITRIISKIPLLGPMITWFLTAIRGVGQAIFKWVGRLIGGFVSGFTGGGSRIVSAVRDIFETVKTTLFVWGDDIIIWFKSLPGRIVQFAEDLGVALRAKFDELMAWIGSIVRTGVDNVVNFFRPVAERLVAIAQDAWTWVVAKFTGMKDAIVGVFAGIRDFVVDRIWAPFATRVSNIAGDVWSWVTDKFTSMKNGVVGIFQTVADTVGSIWNSILDIVKQPVRVVLDFINNSIIGNINRVTENFGLTIPTIRYNFATGGIVPGGYSPGRDNTIAAVGSGEAIMRPEWTRTVGADYVNSANRAARTGGIAGVKDFVRRGGPAFANGGIVGQGNESGGPLSWMGDRISDAWNWATDGIEGLLAQGAAFALKHLVQPAVGWVTDNVGNPFVKDFASGAMTKLVTAVENWGQDKDSEQAANSSDAAAPRGGAVGTPPAGSSFQQLFATVKAAFPEARMNSGLRPGDPGFHGRGQAVDLGQVGRSGGNGHPYLAAMNRWIADSYPNSRELIYTGAGDDRSDIKNGRAHTYNAATRAGHKNHVHWVYDDGGILEPGLTTVHNKSGKPEAVFTNDEFEVFKQIVAGGGPQPLVGSMTFVVDPNASMNDQVSMAMHEFRRLQRGGRAR